MSLNQPIKDLEKAESIPQGTTYVASMGNGSGTKAVTQEVLTQAVGEALKIGNPQELQTTNKESLVGAINEVKQSGGGGASIDVLDSKEEIEANTQEGKSAGALALKEMFGALNDNVVFPDGTKFYPDVKNGVRGYNTDPQRGADTFCPFSNFKGEATFLKNELYPNGENNTITISEAKQYKAIFASFMVKSTGEYTITVEGGTLTCGWGSNYDGCRHHSAVILPTSDTIVIRGMRKSVYICGVK